MSFFDRIAKRIKRRFKKAQTIGYDPISEVDEAIDSSPVEPQFRGGLSPEQILPFVTKAREFLEKVDPNDPYGSLLPPLPDAFKHPQIRPYFIQSANYILKQEKMMDSAAVDEFVGFLLGDKPQPRPLAEPSVDESIKNQIADYMYSIPKDLTQIPPIKPELLKDMELFQSVARGILSSNDYGLNEKQSDEVIRAILNSSQQVQTVNKAPIEKTEEENRFDKLPESIRENITPPNALYDPRNLYLLMDDLDQKLGGSDLYTIKEKPVGKRNDLYPVEWASPSAKLFREAFIDTRDSSGEVVVNEDGSPDMAKMEAILEGFGQKHPSGGVSAIQKVIGLVGKYTHKQLDKDEVISTLWMALRPENIPLGRTMRVQPKKGTVSCLKDYLVDFFVDYPMYLGSDIKLDLHGTDRINTKGEKIVEPLFNGINICKTGVRETESWEIRKRLSDIIANLIRQENKDVEEYVYRKTTNGVANIFLGVEGVPLVSLDKETDVGDALGTMIDKSKVQDVSSSDISKKDIRAKDNITQWDKLGQYASKEAGGGGNIFRELYDEIGQPTIDSMSSYIESLNSGEIKVREKKNKTQEESQAIAILKNSLITDSLQAFMLMGSNQVDSLFKEDQSPNNFSVGRHKKIDKDTRDVVFDYRRGTIKNDKNDVGQKSGKLFLNMDTGEIASWRSLISGHDILKVSNDISEAKALISQVDKYRAGSNLSSIGNLVSKQLESQGVTTETDPVVHTMLQDANFVSRSMLNPSYIEPMKKLYGGNVKQLRDKLNLMHNYFLEHAVKSIIVAENNIRNTYANDPKTMDMKLQRLAKSREIFGKTYLSHSYFESEEEGSAVGGKVNAGLTRLFGRPTTPRAAWWMVTNRMKIPPIKESIQFINGLYKQGNSIIAELIKAQKMLGGFGLGKDVINTINKIGDDYRKKIELLKD